MGKIGPVESISGSLETRSSGDCIMDDQDESVPLSTELRIKEKVYVGRIPSFYILKNACLNQLPQKPSAAISNHAPSWIFAESPLMTSPVMGCR